MTVYLCDTCASDHPGGVRGTAFLVHPNGRTDHFCSQACLRAFVNRGTDAQPWPQIIGAIIIVSAICGAIIDSFIRH